MSYSLTIDADHQIFWQQDVYGNRIAKVHFNGKLDKLSFEVRLDVDVQGFNPFNFLIDERSQIFPFLYPPHIQKVLLPFLRAGEQGPRLSAFLNVVAGYHVEIISFLSELTKAVHFSIAYNVRFEQGVQTAEETLLIKSGSCRDSAWLLVVALRHLGLASRFVSGYLIQVPQPPVDSLELHAWAEVFIPGAGWLGLDTTSGLFAGESHIALAVGPSPQDVSPVVGTTDFCFATMEYTGSVIRS